MTGCGISFQNLQILMLHQKVEMKMASELNISIYQIICYYQINYIYVNYK